MNKPSPVLQCHQLTIAFNEQTLIEPFDWQVRSGERWAVLGANGSGKTSLLHALLGISVGSLDTASHISMMGQSLDTTSVETQALWRVWVPQRYDEPFTVTVIQALRSMMSEASAEEAMLMLAAFGLQSHARSWVHQLSGGERQRLTWAMASLRAKYAQGQTHLWLLDEPLSAQDIAWQQRLLQFLQTLDASVIATVHDLNQVARFATHVLLLGEGGVLAHGLRNEVMQPHWLQRAFGVEMRLDEQGMLHW